MEITYFKSSLDSHLFDLLWNKYWVSTLSSSKIISGTEYVTRLSLHSLPLKLPSPLGSISEKEREEKTRKRAKEGRK